ncbi:MAG TPA: (2Fe-2S)-binding protein [Candidatus Bathyarchaeia archaeon]|nr:(2Fe-2S)-binding protein [Candidatus Bathyarchaeia archaeon]
MRTRFRVNGKDVEVDVEPRRLLVSVLRDELGLTGTHVGCDTTNCGACTILVNGDAVKSCTMLAVQADGAEITTVEGLAGDDALHPVQQAFVEKHGLQCGFCTPGMVVTACWLLSKRTDWTDPELRRHLTGNLCRCTGYKNIIESVMRAQELLNGGHREGQ